MRHGTRACFGCGAVFTVPYAYPSDALWLLDLSRAGGEPCLPKGASFGPPGEATKAYAHTLSFRLTAEQYSRLRRFSASREDATGYRVTHQAIIEDALAGYLDKHGG